MKLFMVRHGESQANVDWHLLKTVRDEDVQLTEKGYLDAVNAGRKLAQVITDIEIVEPIFIVSSWTRTRQTYSIIAGVLALEGSPIISNKVTEHFMNLVDHAPNWEKFEKYKESGFSWLECKDLCYEGGESLEDVRVRCQKFIDSLRTLNEDDVVVLVGHGKFINLTISILLDVDSDSIPHINNGQVVELDLQSS